MFCFINDVAKIFFSGTIKQYSAALQSKDLKLEIFVKIKIILLYDVFRTRTGEC